MELPSPIAFEQPQNTINTEGGNNKNGKDE